MSVNGRTLHTQIYPSRRKFHLATGIAISLAVVYCYSSVFLQLFHKWNQDDMYSFGVLIPLISGYLVWLKYDDLNTIIKKPDKITGFFVLAGGLLSLFLGRMSSILVIQEFSFIVSVIGIVLILFGRQTFFLLWFPILYLVFMIPFWNILLDPLHFPFQIISATLGVKLVNIFGIPVFQSGQFIELPNITLEVAELCSGVNYLISIVAIGIPLCYLYLKRWVNRIALLLFAVLVAIFSNSLRVAGVTLFTYYGGITSAENIHGPFDIFRALVISVIGISMLCLGVVLLKEKKNPHAEPVAKAPIHANTMSDDISYENSGTYYVFPVITFLFILSVGYTIHSHAPVQVPLDKSFLKFPYNIEGWEGEESESSFAVIRFKEMGVSEELSRIYVNENGRKIHLYVGYYDYQDQEKELINYKLDYLFKYSKYHNINLSSSKIHDVNIYFNSNDPNNIIVYWFDINGIKTNNRIKAKAYILKNSILYDRSNAAIIMISTTIRPGDDKDKIVTECREFIAAIYPPLSNHIPRI